MSQPLPIYTVETLEAEAVADFPSFTRDDATRLGEIAVAVIRERGLSLAVDIRIGDELAFRAQLGATGEENAESIAGKVLTVTALSQSSLLARRRQEADPTFGAELDESFKFWGGSIPIFVDGVLAANIATSGEPDVVDHAASAEALTRYRATRA